MSQIYHILSDSDNSEPEDLPGVINTYLNDNQLNSQSSLSETDSKGKSQKRRRTKDDIANEKSKKLEKAAEKAKLQYILPATCLDYISMNISRNIASNSSFSCLTVSTHFNLSNPVEITNLREDSIFWVRKSISGEHTEEPHLIILWNHVMLLSNIKEDNVNNYFYELQMHKPSSRIYFVIYGLKDYCRRIRKKSLLTVEEKILKINPSKDLVESVLCKLQIMNRIQSTLIDSLDDLILFIKHTTKSVGESLYRKEKDKTEATNRWFLHEDSRSCVKIDKQNFGMVRLWLQQLAQIPNSSMDSAKSIAAIYPSPYALYQAYKSIDVSERETLLQNIIVGRVGSTKRIGPELSRKISLLFS